MATSENPTPGDPEYEQMFPQVPDQEWLLGFGCGGSGVSGYFGIAYASGRRDRWRDFAHRWHGHGNQQMQSGMQDQLAEFAGELPDRSSKLSEEGAADLRAIVLAKCKPGTPRF
jgi:hypothetical protein